MNDGFKSWLNSISAIPSRCLLMCVVMKWRIFHKSSIWLTVIVQLSNAAGLSGSLGNSQLSLTVSFPSAQDWDRSQTVCCSLSTYNWDRQAVNQMSRCKCECPLLLSIFISVLSLSLSLLILNESVGLHSCLPPSSALSLSPSLFLFPSKIPLLVSIPDSHVLQQWGMQPLPRCLTLSFFLYVSIPTCSTCQLIYLQYSIEFLLFPAVS